MKRWPLLLVLTLPLAQAETVRDVDPVDISVGLHAIWGITPADYERYLQLKRGPAGAFGVANLTPHEVLGYYAETDEERQHWARAFVAMHRAYATRYLAFQQAVDAVKRVPFQAGFSIQRLRTMDFQPGDRLLLLVNDDCAVVCTLALETALERVEQHATLGLDLYIEPGAGHIIRAAFAQSTRWAKLLNQKGRVTLDDATEEERALFGTAPFFLLHRLDGSLVELGPVSG